MQAKKAVHVAIYTTLISSMALSGCSSTKSDEPAATLAAKATEQSKSLVKKTKITFNIKPDDGAAQEQKDLINNQIKAINDKLSDVEIEATFYRYTPETFIPRVEAKKVDTMTFMYATETRPLAAKGLLKPLDAYLDKVPELKKALNMDIVKQISVGGDGKAYSIPIKGNVQMLLYNRARFTEAGLDPNKPPKTWDELVEYAKKLTDPAKNKYGIQINGADAEAAWKFQNYVFQAGGDMEALKDGAWKSSFNSDQGVQALQFMKDLKWKHKVAHPNVLTNQDESMRLLATGEAGMVLGDYWVVSQAVNQYGGKIKDIGIALLPTGPGGNAGWLMGGSIAAFPNYATDEEVIAGLKVIYELYYKLDRDTVDKDYFAQVKGREVVGVPRVYMFQSDSEAASIVKEAVKKYAVVPEGNIKFDPFADLAKGLKQEPPQEAQLLYKKVSVAIQKVLTDENADPKQELDKAAVEVDKVLDRNVNKK
ncbi:sugar ABC transporter substrate-binding protein [Paenibacillus marchantiophytorum]|uniref:Sugar ABC transporter substrate-binding protein n=1 Tax=Paenibacillus marchantiophytorum TaxID=1619310 RepID=A0ABQ1EXF7_9BACL|nr:extracellular solute-binding protein [Paenibacillus marchantiophytorum]GFZ91867.1 sugar ABC transporter substrate-binding protein [Paenibacillus marchantiophytorum]